MKHRRARVYDALAFLTAILVLILDQWTKAWVVTNLSPSYFGPRVSLIGDYLTLYYIRNNGAAFSLFANSIVLVLLIAVAIGVIVYLYLRNINTGSLWYKLIFGLIIGGALSNLIDRVLTLVFGSILKPEEASKKTQAAQETTLKSPVATGSEVLQPSKEHDAQH